MIRKLSSIFFITACLFFTRAVLWAAPGAVLTPAAGDASRVGVAAAVRGSVQLARSGQAGIVVQSGMPVHLGDEIKTDAQGQLQILLLDETVFTIGPDSAMVIDQFVYDPASSSGKVEARVVKGVFRFVTGKIAHKNPDDMEVKLPNGTIGIRGTIVQGRADSGKSLAVLMGPGEQNNAGLPPGGMLMKSEVNGKTVTTEIFKTGFGSEIEGDNSAPKPAFKVPEDTLNQMNSELSPPAQDLQDAGGEDTGMQGSATENAGQDKAGWGRQTGDQGVINRVMRMLDKDTAESAQDNAEGSAAILDGPSTHNQLHLLASQLGGGIHHFSQSGLSLTNQVGSTIGTAVYDMQIDIDFSSRRVGGGNSKITTSTFPGGFFSSSTNPGFDIPHQAFGAGPAPAVFVYTDLPQTAGTGCSPGACVADFILTPFNSGGRIAEGAFHAVHITQASNANEANGAGAAPRSPGPSS